MDNISYTLNKEEIKTQGVKLGGKLHDYNIILQGESTCP